MDSFISPSFDWQKLEDPTIEDMVDVFEDRIKNWLLLPCDYLLRTQHGFVATINLLMSYFEGIQVYISGSDSKGASEKFFVDGFLAVFGSHGLSKNQLKGVAKTMYKEARCGFFHDGMSRGKILYSRGNNNALLITLPKINGNIIYDGEIDSVVINPERFLECVKKHFQSYIDDLRYKRNINLQNNFKKAVDLKWYLGQEIKMPFTNEEFRKFGV